MDLTYLLCNFCNIRIRFNLIIRLTQAHAQISIYKSFLAILVPENLLFWDQIMFFPGQPEECLHSPYKFQARASDEDEKFQVYIVHPPGNPSSLEIQVPVPNPTSGPHIVVKVSRLIALSSFLTSITASLDIFLHRLCRP